MVFLTSFYEITVIFFLKCSTFCVNFLLDSVFFSTQKFKSHKVYKSHKSRILCAKFKQNILQKLNSHYSIENVFHFFFYFTNGFWCILIPYMFLSISMNNIKEKTNRFCTLHKIYRFKQIIINSIIIALSITDWKEPKTFKKATKQKKNIRK